MPAAACRTFYSTDTVSINIAIVKVVSLGMEHMDNEPIPKTTVDDMKSLN